jgi:hypothetical protein
VPDIRAVHDRFARIGGAELEVLRRDPRRAILEDEIICLVCGRLFRHLTNTHLAHHGLTSEAYKLTFGYNGRRSLMAHAVRRRHADNAVRRGLAQMIRRRPIVADPALRARGGTRLRAREEWLHRRESGRRPGSVPPRDASGRFMTAGLATAEVS